MMAFATNSLRELVDAANSMKIEKEDIVSLLYKGGQYELVYYVTKRNG